MSTQQHRVTTKYERFIKNKNIEKNTHNRSGFKWDESTTVKVSGCHKQVTFLLHKGLGGQRHGLHVEGNLAGLQGVLVQGSLQSHHWHRQTCTHTHTHTHPHIHTPTYTHTQTHTQWDTWSLRTFLWTYTVTNSPPPPTPPCPQPPPWCLSQNLLTQSKSFAASLYRKGWETLPNPLCYQGTETKCLPTTWAF